MPVYEYECQEVGCQIIHQKYYNMMDYPDSIKCTNCGGVAVKIISKSNILTGAGKARVFYQYKGDPKTCPPDLRDALKSQDRPKGLPEFAREAQAVVSEGQKQAGRESFK